MAEEQFSRTEMQLGGDNMNRLARARVAVFGIGGVGGHCVEALARSGIGHLDLYDSDRIAPSNINRQIIALHSTVGQPKTEAMKARILDINPGAEVGSFQLFYDLATADSVDLSRYDYVVDAVDTVTAKLELICRAAALGVPVISAMGAGNKLDAAQLEVSDIYSTSVCPLARVMRRELRKRGIGRLKVVYSREEPIVPPTMEENGPRRSVPSSNAFVPAVAGLLLGGEVIRDLCGISSNR